MAGTQRLTDESARALIGMDPERLSRELHEFRENAVRLSKQHPRMIEEYPDQWIVLHSGTVKVHGPTLQSVLHEVDCKGLPRHDIIVRHISTEPRTLIL